jgi:hypothetical protein
MTGKPELGGVGLGRGEPHSFMTSWSSQVTTSKLKCCQLGWGPRNAGREVVVSTSLSETTTWRFLRHPFLVSVKASPNNLSVSEMEQPGAVPANSVSTEGTDIMWAEGLSEFSTLSDTQLGFCCRYVCHRRVNWDCVCWLTLKKTEICRNRHIDVEPHLHIKLTNAALHVLHCHLVARPCNWTQWTFRSLKYIYIHLN